MKFNNGLGLLIISGCFLTAWGQGFGWLSVPDFVLGALYTTGFTLVIQFYFRKKEGE